MTNGDYYRLLGNGDYAVTVTAEGYHPSTKCVTVENVMYVGSGTATEAAEVDFTLTPASDAKPEDVAADAVCEHLRHVGQAVQSEVNNVKGEEKIVMEVGAGVSSSVVNTGILCCEEALPLCPSKLLKKVGCSVANSANPTHLIL